GVLTRVMNESAGAVVEHQIRGERDFYATISPPALPKGEKTGRGARPNFAYFSGDRYSVPVPSPLLDRMVMVQPTWVHGSDPHRMDQPRCAVPAGRGDYGWSHLV